MNIFALAAGNAARRLSDLALLLGAIGALLVALGAAAFLRGARDDQGRRNERTRTLIGASLIAAAFLLLLVVRAFLQ